MGLVLKFVALAADAAFAAAFAIVMARFEDWHE